MGTEGQHESGLDCDEALHRLYHFLDGELTATRRAEIEAHLNGCSPCVDMYGFEAELRRVIACKCQESVPAELRERIAIAIHHEHSRTAQPK
jgi:mycothiol system anti-sigma-R factor